MSWHIYAWRLIGEKLHSILLMATAKSGWCPGLSSITERVVAFKGWNLAG